MPREDSEKQTLFPSKSARYICWAARDAFWECIDKSEGDESACKALRKTYEESCPPMWVKHFDRKKKYMEFQEKVKEGYEPLKDT